MWSFETTKPQKLTLEEAFKSLDSFISECAKVWEREHLDWAPPLLVCFEISAKRQLL